MHSKLTADLCVIGAGSAGLSIAAGAAQLGVSVVLLETNKMGGDCLNYGCVPSKSLLAAAKAANTMRRADIFGISAIEPQIDMAKVMAGVQAVIHTLAPHDSVKRFEKLGVTVIQAAGHFLDKSTVIAGEYSIKARRFVIATGSSPAIPPIPGLDKTPYYTNETIFNLTLKPDHLIVIGGGPIGCELAQAFLLLGVKVTVLEAFHILPRDEPDLVAILRDRLLSQNLNLYENTKITKVAFNNSQIEVTVESDGQQTIIQGSHLLVATGRKPNVQHLNLPAAGITYTVKGIKIDSRLRTTNPFVYALGDVIGSYQFTHVANYQAGIVIRNILFRFPAKVDYRAMPWTTYTDPELAHVGLTSTDAVKLDSKAKILTFELAANDRAQTEHETSGKIKLITTAKGKILGVSILASHAGELLMPWIMLIQGKKPLKNIINTIVPYPTLSEINKGVASEFYKPILFSKATKRLVKFLGWFG